MSRSLFCEVPDILPGREKMWIHTKMRAKSTFPFAAFAALIVSSLYFGSAPAAFAANSGADAAPQLPRKAMPFGVQTAPDQYIWLNTYEGKTVVVAFILTTCPHCQFTTGVLNHLQAEFANRGLQIIESAAEMMAGLHVADFKAKFHPAFPVGYNDQRYIAKLLGMPEDAPMLFPTIAIIDAHGMIRAQLSGDDAPMNKDIQEKTLRGLIEKAMEEGRAPRRTPAAR